MRLLVPIVMIVMAANYLIGGGGRQPPTSVPPFSEAELVELRAQALSQGRLIVPAASTRAATRPHDDVIPPCRPRRP